MSRLEKLIASLTCFVGTGFFFLPLSLSLLLFYRRHENIHNDFGELITGRNFGFALPWFAVWKLAKHKGLKCRRHSSQEEEAGATVLVCHQGVSSQLWKIVFIPNLNSESEDIYLSTVATTHFLIEFITVGGVGGGSVVTDIHFNITPRLDVLMYY